ncbi:MAG: ATP-binding protein [Pseudomonadota bacterium]
MNIRFKLLLVALTAFLAYLLVMFTLWMPLQLQQARNNFVSNQHMILTAMESDLIRHLLAHDYAALYSSLDQQMQQQASWDALSLHLANGRRLYPLFTAQDASPLAPPTQLALEHPIVLGEREMARVSLQADWQVVRQQTFEAIYRLVAFLAVAFIAVIALGLVLAERFVRPLLRLTDGAQHIAEGNYEVSLPSPGRDEIGDLTRSFQTMRDKLAQTRQALTQTAAKAEQAERYQRSVLENIGEGLVSINENGQLLSANPAAADIFGYAYQQMAGLLIGNLILEKPMQAVVAAGQPVGKPRRMQGLRVDGTHFPLEIVLTSMTVDGRQVYNLILRDITLREQTEQALREARDAAEATARVKTDFLANMSHEIRTPLNAVLGMSRIGLRESREPKCQESFNHILDSGQHLLGVINDILDFSKIEAGKLTIELHPFQLIACVENIAGQMAERAEATGLEFKVNFDGNLPAWVEGDPLRLQQILLNLLSNAIKFTQQGSVSLCVTRDGEMTYFRVSDSGIGMSEDELSRLFIPFVQADSSTTRKYGGSGLGLTISQNLANLVGGEIKAESQVGAGSVFTLILPLQVSQPPIEKDTVSSSVTGMQLSGLRILAAEDVELNRIILEDLLEQEGARVVFAEDGQQALDRLEELGVTSFDLVLMDVQMPVMDGYEATRQIREMAPGLPVIGLTAHALAEERKKCLATGMVEHITKPIDPNSLIAAIRRHVDMPSACP